MHAHFNLQTLSVHLGQPFAETFARYVENRHITGVERFLLCNSDKSAERDVKLMIEIAFAKLHEGWKRKDLLVRASETMPKQVDKDKVLDDLRKLHCEYTEDLSEET